MNVSDFVEECVRLLIEQGFPFNDRDFREFAEQGYHMARCSRAKNPSPKHTVKVYKEGIYSKQADNDQWRAAVGMGVKESLALARTRRET